MKKLIALLLALTLVVAFAGCEKKEEKVETVAALTALETAWNAMPDEQKPFAFGGGYETMVDNAPGAVPAEDTAFMSNILLIPEAELAKVSAAASVLHAMNTNTFCVGALNLVEGADYGAFATTMRDAIQSNRWMCGFPEKLHIANVGNCLVIAYGNGELVDNFCGNLANATVLYDEAIQG